MRAIYYNDADSFSDIISYRKSLCQTTGYFFLKKKKYKIVFPLYIPRVIPHRLRACAMSYGPNYPIFSSCQQKVYETRAFGPLIPCAPEAFQPQVVGLLQH